MTTTLTTIGLDLAKSVFTRCRLRTQSTGLPTRVHQQVEKLRKIHGVGSVDFDLYPIGRTTTGRAIRTETLRLQQFYDTHGFVPKGNLGSFTPRTIIETPY